MIMSVHPFAPSIILNIGGIRVRMVNVKMTNAVPVMRMATPAPMTLMDKNPLIPKPNLRLDTNDTSLRIRLPFLFTGYCGKSFSFC
jgi:hypothetical protein